MKRKALVTGITGQDGSYLAELLLSKDYDVVGMHRRSSTVNFDRIAHLVDRITLVSGDLLDEASMIRILREHKPHEIYNLAAQSFVQTSFDQALKTYENLNGFLPTTRTGIAGAGHPADNRSQAAALVPDDGTASPGPLPRGVRVTCARVCTTRRATTFIPRARTISPARPTTRATGISSSRRRLPAISAASRSLLHLWVGERSETAEFPVARR